MQFTTRAGLRKPEDAESADIADLNFNSDQLSDYAVGDFICTSVTRPGAPWVGMRIFETDTTANLVYVGGADPWKPTSIVICTSVARPANPVLGQEIFETDTKALLIWDGTGWKSAVNRNKAVLTADTTAFADGTERVITQGAETLLVTLDTLAGVEYRLEFYGRPLSTVVGDRLRVNIRRTNLAGLQVAEGMRLPGFASVGDSLSIVAFDTPGAGNTTWVATFTRAGGTGTARLVAAATGPAFLEVRRA